MNLEHRARRKPEVSGGGGIEPRHKPHRDSTHVRHLPQLQKTLLDRRLRPKLGTVDTR